MSERFQPTPPTPEERSAEKRERLILERHGSRESYQDYLLASTGRMLAYAENNLPHGKR